MYRPNTAADAINAMDPQHAVTLPSRWQRTERNIIRTSFNYCRRVWTTAPVYNVCIISDYSKTAIVPRGIQVTDRDTYGHVCLSVFSTRYLKNRCSYRITQLDTDMFHHESWKLIYFEVKKSKVKVTWHKNKYVSLFRRNSILTLAAYKHLRWVFPTTDAAADRRFFHAWSFSQREKKHCRRAWAMALLYVLASSSY